MATELGGDGYWHSRMMHNDGHFWRLGATDATYADRKNLPLELSPREFHLLMAGEQIEIAGLRERAA